MIDDLEYYSYDDSYDSSYFDDRMLMDSQPREDISIHAVEDQLHHQTPSPPVEVANDDDRIAFSLSVNQSRLFLQNTLGISHNALRSSHVPGLVILRLEDFNVIRDTSSRNREVPHFLYLANPADNDEFHPELDRMFTFLNHPRF